MSSWEKVSLGSIAEFKNGLNYSKDNFGKGIKVLNVSDFKNHSTPSIETLTEINPDGLIKDSYLLQEGDIVFVRSNGNKELVGRSVFIKHLTERVTFSGFCIRARFTDDRALSSYFAHLFRSDFIRNILSTHSGGANINNLNQDILASLDVPLPPLPIQRRIAEILGRYDALIDNYQRQISALESMAQELYREWFVRGRCPYAQPGEDGGLPVGWEKRVVESCFDILGGGTPPRDEPNFWEDGTVNWFTPTDITGSGGFFLKESSEKITSEGLNSSSARLFPAYSVMMTSRATIGAVAINTEKASTNQGFIVCLPNQQFSFAFIYLWITHNKHIFEMLASGATFLEIPKSIFKKINVIVPTDRVLEAFDKTAIPIFKKIENLQTQLTILRQTRDAFLPKLLSGQLAVEGTEVSA